MSKNILIIIICLVVISGLFIILQGSGNNDVSNMEVNNKNESSKDLTAAIGESLTPQGSGEEGLKIEILQEGTGEGAKNNDKVSVHYTGTLEDGIKFDSSLDRGTPFVFTLGIGQVIKGWDLGVLGMKVGGKRRLEIASELAYGTGGIPGAIPPNATLVFEVELLGINE